MKSAQVQRQVHMIQKQLDPQQGPDDVDACSQLSSGMQVRTRAGETFSRRRHAAFSRRRRRVAFKEGPNEAVAEFKDVGTPACTREGESAQTAERVVVTYLDRKARAPTTNRRSRSGVGGARRGVRYGAVNDHKVALKEQAKTRQFSSKLKRAETERERENRAHHHPQLKEGYK